MSITAASISGGFTDDDATDPGNTFNAVNEYQNFVDQISVDLLNDLMVPYTSIDVLDVVVRTYSTPVSSNEITNNGAVTLNLTYSTSNTNSVSTLTVITSIESSNTVGNVYITGNVQNAFPDKYWEYNDLLNNTAYLVTTTSSIPNEDIGIFTYKPSFIRYVNLYFDVTVEYDGGAVVETRTLHKKIYNDWDINRLELISLVSRENQYRQNNYPKEY